MLRKKVIKMLRLNLMTRVKMVKVVITGEVAVGKTSLIKRFLKYFFMISLL